MIEKVEKIVNDEIAASLRVVTDVMSLDEAQKYGAMALVWRVSTGEKVRVCQDGGFLHRALRRYARIQHRHNCILQILSDGWYCSRRPPYRGADSTGLMYQYKEVENELHEAAILAMTTPAARCSKIESMLEEIKTLHAENEKLKVSWRTTALGDVMNQVQDVNGVKLLAVEVKDVDMTVCGIWAIQLKEMLGDGVVLIAVYSWMAR